MQPILKVETFSLGCIVLVGPFLSGADSAFSSSGRWCDLIGSHVKRLASLEMADLCSLGVLGLGWHCETSSISGLGCILLFIQLVYVHPFLLLC